MSRLHAQPVLTRFCANTWPRYQESISCGYIFIDNFAYFSIKHKLGYSLEITTCVFNGELSKNIFSVITKYTLIFTGLACKVFCASVHILIVEPMHGRKLDTCTL